MDKFEMNPQSQRFKQVAMQSVMREMASLRTQKDLEAEKQDETEWSWSKIQVDEAGDRAELPLPDKTVQPETAPGMAPASPPENDSQDSQSQPSMEDLLQQMPEEVRKAAEQMVRAHIDKKARPSQSLGALKQPDHLHDVETMAGDATVLEVLIERQPIPILIED